MRPVIGIALTAAIFAAGASAANAAFVGCPLTEARRTITDRLPPQWWTTPIVDRLSDTRVSNIGGKPAMICIYGNSGSIQRNVPDGQNCAAVRGGFNCQARAPAGPRTFSTGRLDIPQTYLFDLDRGAVTEAGADFWFQAETRDLLYIVPRNGALMGVGDRSNRGQRGCASARLSRDRVSLRDVPPGSYVCVKTDRGRVSQFRVNSISSGSPKTLSIGYTTWR